MSHSSVQKLSHDSNNNNTHMCPPHLFRRRGNDITKTLREHQFRFDNFICVVICSILFKLLIQSCSPKNKPAGQIKSTIALTSSIPSVSHTQNGQFARVTLLSDTLVHVETAEGTPSPSEHISTTPMVAMRSFVGPTSFSQTETESSLVVGTPRMRVRIDKTTLCVETARFNATSDRTDVLTQTCPQRLTESWKGVTFEVPSVRAAYGLGQHFSNPETSDGDLLGRVIDSGPYGNELRGFSGGANSIVQIPVVFVLRNDASGFGFFFDNQYKQRWDFTRQPWQANAFGSAMRYFVFADSTLREARSSYMALTGKPPVPPRKMFGLWVSEFGFDSWSELETKRKGLLEANIPHDGFVLDLQWFGGEFLGSKSRMGSLSFYEPWFPNPKETIARLKAEGAGIITVEESYIDENLPEHSNLASRGYLARKCDGCEPAYLTANPWWGKGGMLDWTLAAAGDYWHDWKREPLIDLGVLGHWTDLGEPEMYDGNAWYHGFPEQGLHAHADIHNLYSLLWAESIFRGYARNKRTQRPFILTRAGAAGIQRTGAAMWSGDIGSNLGALKAQATAQSHMSFSGIDYYGSDTGGFHRWSLDGDVGALYTQWFAQSALFDLPLRPHSWNTANIHETSPHAIGHVPSNRSNAQLRYQLFPYYYSLSHSAHRDGSPFVYPPLIDFPDDPVLARLGHQKMIGPWLLAGMVADYRGTQRSFYFPDALWFDFRTGQRIDARLEWEDEVPTVDDQGNFGLPLFARGGALIPLGNTQALTVRAFPAEGVTENRFLVIEDDGETTAYKRGAVAETPLLSRTKHDLLQEIEIRPTRGSFSGMQQSRDVTIEAVFGQKDVFLSGASLNDNSLPRCTESLPPCFSRREANDKYFAVIRLEDVDRSKNISIKLKWGRSPTETRQPRALLFVCENAVTRPGESIYVVGNHRVIGNWNLSRAVRLEPTLYPHWSRSVQGFQAGDSLEWKCVKLREHDLSLSSWSARLNTTVAVQEGLFAQPTRHNF